MLDIKYGETTADKKFTLLPNACLGCCDHAPALMVDSKLYTNVKEEMLGKIFQKYEWYDNVLMWKGVNGQITKIGCVE